MLEILREHSLFLQLTRAGVQPITFANTYTQGFFVDRPRWVSATTAAMEAAGVPFRRVADLKAGRAVFHDFTNAALIERNEDVPLRTAEEAAEVLAHISAANRFTLYEYFITDKVGHLQDIEKARGILLNLAKLVRAVLKQIDLTSNFRYTHQRSRQHRRFIYAQSHAQPGTNDHLGRPQGTHC